MRNFAASLRRGARAPGESARASLRFSPSLAKFDPVSAEHLKLAEQLARTMPPQIAASPEGRALRQILEAEQCPRLTINALFPGVICPDAVRNQWRDRLLIDLDPASVYSLVIDIFGVRARLSFAGVASDCSFPWGSIYTICDRSTGRGIVIDARVPPARRPPFGESMARSIPADVAARPEGQVLAALFREEKCPRLCIDALHPGVVCPAWVRERWREQLPIDLAPTATLRLVIDAAGIRAQLSFGGVLSDCSFPWASIYMIVDRATGRGVRFDERDPRPPRP